MVNVALLAAPLPLAPTVKLSVLLPLPLLLPSVSHGVFVDAVQLQPAPVVIPTLPNPPAAGCTGLLALKVKLHGTPACVTANGWEATMTLAARFAVVEFAAIERLTVPLPVPDGAPVGEIQPGPVLAVHEHPAGALTPKEAGPPAEVMAVPALVRENVHPTPASVTLSIWPAILIIPVRV
jgi:hypothetical protein